MKRIAAAFFFAFFAICYLQIADADAQFRPHECRYGFCVPGGGPSGNPISNACSTSSGTTITFTAQGTGGANPSRISVVTIAWDDSTAAGTAQLTGVTLGGNAMTRAVRTTAGVANSNSEIWYVANPTGTTANIVLTSASAIDGVTIEVYRLIGYDTVSSFTTGTTSVTQAYDNKQLAIAVGSRTVNVSTSLSNMINDFSSACGANLWGVHASQALHGNGGSLTSAISPTSNNPKIALAKWTVGFVASCTQSSNFIARTSGLTSVYKADYDVLICGMVTDGTFSKFDMLHVYATNSSSNAVLNLIQNSFNGTINGSPTFTIDRGFTGTNASTTIYIDTGFNGNTASSPKYTLNAAHFSFWQLNNIASPNDYAMGALQTGPIAQSYMTIVPGQTFICLNNINTSCGQNTTLAATTIGHFLLNRPDNTGGTAYYNGATTGVTFTNNNAIPNLNFHTIGINQQGNVAFGSAAQLSAATIGSNLSTTDITNVYNRLHTWMTARGIP